jgi:hypothetical protein
MAQRLLKFLSGPLDGKEGLVGDTVGRHVQLISPTPNEASEKLFHVYERHERRIGDRPAGHVMLYVGEQWLAPSVFTK